MDDAIPTVTPDQMSQVDQIMAEEFGVGTPQLMEIAGYAVAAWARERLPGGDARGARVVVLAGSGGNGGDSMVAARLLHGWGARVAVWLSHPPASLRGAAAQQAASLRALGIAVWTEDGGRRMGDGSRETEGRGQGRGRHDDISSRLPTPDSRLVLPEAELIIDGLLGFGLRGAPEGVAARLIGAANAHPAPTLAIDLPSGLNGLTGEPYAPCVQAAATLTLALPKTGLLAPAAHPYVGELFVADIGVPPEAYARVGVTVGPIFSERSVLRLTGTRGTDS